jgi:lysophospholipase L1-like esterase
MSISYLALGDSYTIGEQVDFSDNFPNQTVQLFRRAGLPFYAAEIIAKTGWTTDELIAFILNKQLLPKYDLVSLLIGVNNQYRGRTVENFSEEFEALLKMAIDFADGNTKNVFVLSIPDWGQTPFAVGRDLIKIAQEIDEYNSVCEMISYKYDCNFINITTAQRLDAANSDFIATDGLHPSGKEYAKWAQKLVDAVKQLLHPVL